MISEIVSTVILVLVVTVLMTTTYIAYMYALNTQVYRIEVSIERIKHSLLPITVIDKYYISENSTIVIILYTSGTEVVEIVRVYVDHQLVDTVNYITGFNTPILPGRFHRISFIYKLDQGTHSILLITDKGGKIETSINV